MRRTEIVIDTCVVAAALRSRRGASFRLLTLVGVSPRFRIHLSVPLALEYEDVGKRHGPEIGLTDEEIDAVVDYLCSQAERHVIFYLWRPFLKDPGDDMVLELAVEAGCDIIVTFNRRDFAGASQFGIRVLTPAEFLEEIGELS